MRLATGSIALSIVAAASLVACSSSGGTPAASDSVNPPAPTDSTASTHAGSGPAHTGTASSGPRPTGTRSHQRRPGRPTAPTSVPIVVPTGTKAPYPTPGKDPALQADQSAVLDSLPGSSSPSCGHADGHTDLRAGSVAAGNFQTAQHDFRTGYGKSESVELNLYVIPQHAGHLHKVTTTVEPLGGGHPQTVTSGSVEQAEASRYFAVQIAMGRPGTYRFTFVSGPDRGCFIASFHA
jgi:hypothetical protein